MHKNPGNGWVTVANAASILCVSKQAVRQRIYRNTIPHIKSADGTVYVRVTPPNDQDHGESPGVDNAVLLDYVETLKDRIKHLEEESNRKDHIIMSLTQRIPELEAPRETSSEAQESPVTPAEEPHITHAPPAAPEHPVERLESEGGTLYGTSRQEAEDSLQRRSSWWRRFFGFE